MVICVLLELPMLAEMDNSVAIDVANSWSFGSHTCHVDVHNFFHIELKDQGYWS